MNFKEVNFVELGKVNRLRSFLETELMEQNIEEGYDLVSSKIETIPYDPDLDYDTYEIAMLRHLTVFLYISSNYLLCTPLNPECETLRFKFPFFTISRN